MNKIHACLLLVGIIILGLINIVYRIIKINKEQEIISDYKCKLIEFLNSVKEGEVLENNLEYLNTNSCEVQDILGGLGFANMVNHIEGIQYMNCKIITNGIDDILGNLMTGITDYIIDDIIETGSKMNMSIGKKIGCNISNKKELLSYVKNPLIWLREGIRVIVGFPIYFLYWSGLIQYSTYSSIKNNIIIRFIGFIIGTLGFIGTIITIVTGYQPFVNIINQNLK